MVTAKLKHLIRDYDRHGHLRYYVRRPGHPKIRIRAKYGTDEFVTEYHAALIGRSLFAEKAAKGRPVKMPAAKGSFRELVEKYCASRDTYKNPPAFGLLALEPSTQGVKRNLLDAVCLETVSDADLRLIGSLPYAIISAEAIKNLRDRRPTIDGANGRLKALRALFDWAVAEKLIARNHAKDVPYLKSKSAGFHTWTVEEVRKYEERHPIGTKARLALGLLIFTGQRRSDVASFGKQHVRKPEHMPADLRALHPGRWLSFRQYKGRNRSPVDLTIPILPGLEEIIMKSPCGDLTFLVTAFGKGFTHAGFGNWFRDRCNEAGLRHCSAHGVRKAGATIAAEQGATAHQLMAIFGWKKLAQAEVYTKAARMAGRAMGLLAMQQKVSLDARVQESGTISAQKTVRNQ